MDYQHKAPHPWTAPEYAHIFKDREDGTVEVLSNLMTWLDDLELTFGQVKEKRPKRRGKGAVSLWDMMTSDPKHKHLAEKYDAEKFRNVTREFHEKDVKHFKPPSVEQREAREEQEQAASRAAAERVGRSEDCEREEAARATAKRGEDSAGRKGPNNFSMFNAGITPASSLIPPLHHMDVEDTRDDELMQNNSGGSDSSGAFSETHVEVGTRTPESGFIFSHYQGTPNSMPAAGYTTHTSAEMPVGDWRSNSEGRVHRAPPQDGSGMSYSRMAPSNRIPGVANPRTASGERKTTQKMTTKKMESRTSLKTRSRSLSPVPPSSQIAASRSNASRQKKHAHHRGTPSINLQGQIDMEHVLARMEEMKTKFAGEKKALNAQFDRDKEVMKQRSADEIRRLQAQVQKLQQLIRDDRDAPLCAELVKLLTPDEVKREVCRVKDIDVVKTHGPEDLRKGILGEDRFQTTVQLAMENVFKVHARQLDYGLLPAQERVADQVIGEEEEVSSKIDARLKKCTLALGIINPKLKDLKRKLKDLEGQQNRVVACQEWLEDWSGRNSNQVQESLLLKRATAPNIFHLPLSDDRWRPILEDVRDHFPKLSEPARTMVKSHLPDAENRFDARSESSVVNSLFGRVVITEKSAPPPPVESVDLNVKSDEYSEFSFGADNGAATSATKPAAHAPCFPTIPEDTHFNTPPAAVGTNGAVPTATAPVNQTAVPTAPQVTQWMPQQAMFVHQASLPAPAGSVARGGLYYPQSGAAAPPGAPQGGVQYMHHYVAPIQAQHPNQQQAPGHFQLVQPLQQQQVVPPQAHHPSVPAYPTSATASGAPQSTLYHAGGNNNAI